MMNTNMQDLRKELLRQTIILLKRKCKSLKVSAEGSKSDIIERIMTKKYGNNQLSKNTEPELSTKEEKESKSHRKPYILTRFNCHLLVTGYIRRLDKLINIIIPNDIVTLCFNNYFQVLPPYRVQNELCYVDEKENIFTTPGTDQANTTFAILETPWKEGIHELRFECIHDVGCAVSIGMVTNANANCKEWLFDDSESHLSYQLYSTSSARSENGIYCFQNGIKKSFKAMGQKVSDGAVISMIVDFNNWTVIYYLDGSQVAECMQIAKNETYYPAIAYNTWKIRCDKENNKSHKYRLLICA